MNTSGQSNRTFDGNIEPIRMPNMNHLNLIDTQALHLGVCTLSADAAEFVPFAQQPLPPPHHLHHQHHPQAYFQSVPPNTYTNSYRGYPGPSGGGGGGNAGGYQFPYQQQPQQPVAGAYHQQQQPPPPHQRLSNSVQSRLQMSSPAAPSNSLGNMFQNPPNAGIPSQQQPYQHIRHPQQPHFNGPLQPPPPSAAGGPVAAQQLLASNGGPFGGAPPVLGGGMDEYGAEPQLQEEAEQTQEEMAALELLRESIEQLKDKPGMFEEYAMDLKEAFADVIDSRLVMSCAIEMLFEQSVADPQCRYMGARLCQLLDTLAGTSVGANLFREMLCLKLAHHETELPGFMQSEQLAVRGSALFLSELYIQLHNDGNDRMVELAHSVLHVIELLLSKAGPENAKCVCQSLKLCGYELDTDVGTAVDRVMDLLVKLQSGLDTSTARLIESVLQLRVSRWGRNNLGTQTRTPAAYNSYSNTDGPVYYGPDGQVLTEDEASFLNSNTATVPNHMMAPKHQSYVSTSAVGSGGDGLGGASASGSRSGGNLDAEDFNAEMDDEMQEAYRQFLRGQQ